MRLAIVRLWLRKIHLYIALALCLPLTAIGVSGSILVFRSEIANLLNPPPHLPIHPGLPHTVTEIISAAKGRISDGFVPIHYEPPPRPVDPAIVRLLKIDAAKARVVTVLVDPVTLDLRPYHYIAFPVWLGIALRLHGSLLIGRAGRVLVGWLGVAMLVLTMSGLVLWWPRRGGWRAALTVDPAARGPRLHRELHGAIGIWTLSVLTIVASSGLYLAFPHTIGAGVRAVLSSQELPGPKPILPADSAERISADRAIKAALSAVPGSRLVSLDLPLRPEQPYHVTLARNGDLRGAPAVVVLVDPWSAKPERVVNPAAFAPAETVLAWQAPIHFGQAIGPVWRVAVCLSGLLPAIFAYTGLTMWLLRRKARRRQIRSARA